MAGPEHIYQAHRGRGPVFLGGNFLCCVCQWYFCLTFGRLKDIIVGVLDKTKTKLAILTLEHLRVTLYQATPSRLRSPLPVIFNSAESNAMCSFFTVAPAAYAEYTSIL